MRDAILSARLGLPSTALVTEEFWKQGDFVARAAGMPEIPRIKLPHPVAGTGKESMAAIAALLVPSIVQTLWNPR